ncbi:MAG: NAD(P)/FAD-dependent oxidoreductase [Candidatus Melainabacteria bacterium]|nr:NAD(P)/FAD-dependent oxidoreductase [Candidatus Melainabacteria bacterium]
MPRTALFRELIRCVSKALFLQDAALQDVASESGAQQAFDERGLKPPVTESCQWSGASLTRRQFLRGSAALLAGGIALGSLPPEMAAWANPSEQHGLHSTGPQSLATSANGKNESPVVIVGAGLAGLTVAYRLTQANVPCVVYEASTRLGGRVYTQDHFNRQGMFCELGGELIDTNHTAIQQLCQELAVPLARFPLPQAGEEEALFDFDGKYYTVRDAVQAFGPLQQQLQQDLAAAFPQGEVYVPTVADADNPELLRLDRQTLETYLAQVPNLAPWFRQMISVAYTGEYGRDVAQQSALNLLLLIAPAVSATNAQSSSLALFGDSDEAMRIQGGNSRLVEALARHLKSRVAIHTQQALQAVALMEDGRVQLQFAPDSLQPVVFAKQVVLALPLTQVRRLRGLDQLGLPESGYKTIMEWAYGTNAKRMIGFKRRFWQQNGEKFPAYSGSSYTDRSSQAFWETSRLQPGTAGILTNFLGGVAGETARPQGIEQTLRDLSAIHQTDITALWDGQQSLMAWARHAWTGGSYSCPAPGQYTACAGTLQQPLLTGSLWFAGEHCSLDFMGYMNGAVDSGELVAKGMLANRIQQKQLQAAVASLHTASAIS